MTDITRPITDGDMDHFRALAEAMREARDPGATDWEWVGEHMSQRMFSITEARATRYAQTYGGTASRMEKS